LHLKSKVHLMGCWTRRQEKDVGIESLMIGFGGPLPPYLPPSACEGSAALPSSRPAKHLSVHPSGLAGPPLVMALLLLAPYPSRPHCRRPTYPSKVAEGGRCRRLHPPPLESSPSFLLLQPLLQVPPAFFSEPPRPPRPLPSAFLSCRLLDVAADPSQMLRRRKENSFRETLSAAAAAWSQRSTA